MIEELKTGNTLKKPAIWKRVQNVVNAVASCLPVVAIFIPEAQRLIDADFAVKLGGAISAIGALNIYWTTATTEKIGL